MVQTLHPLLSHKLGSITKKLKRDAAFSWNQQDQSAIDLIFKEIKQQTLLSIPDYSKPFILNTDGSGQAIGAVLYQGDKVIGFFSRKLSDSQRNYSNTERELLAIIEGLEYFRSIIYGATIEARTDHANLLYGPELSSSRAQR